jgi:hypothetical protein
MERKIYPGIKNDGADEGQQQFTGLELSQYFRHWRERPTSKRRTCLGQNKGVVVMSWVVSCEMVASQHQRKQRTLLESVTSQD